MTLGTTDEHRDLRDAVRAFTAKAAPEHVLRAAVEADVEELPPFWGELAGQGLLGAHLPERLGGGGAELVELAVIVEEMGRGLVPGPFLPTVLAGEVLRRAGHERWLGELAAGERAAAVGLEAGTLTVEHDSGRPVLRGRSGAVLGGHIAGLFVLPAADRRGTGWVVVPSAELDVEHPPGHDPTRRLGVVEADGVELSPDAVLALDDPDLPRQVAAVLVAAEASGIADWATTTAAEYAAQREQFGRAIGSFQAVKHRCARMLARAEQARVCAWDAARAAGGGDPQQAAMAAAVAGATSADAAFEVTKDCVQVLGGIGFTWEHAAGLYLRRAQTLRAVLGTGEHWRRRVARLALGDVRRKLAVDLPPQAEQTRTAVRAELDDVARSADVSGALADRGFTAPHLPAPWGRDADAVAQLVIAEELDRAGLQPPDMVIGNWVVPTLVEHGSTEQQQRFLPPTLRGDLVWCQLFSEPEAGSDLAALRTSARRVSGGWRLTGQKVWTSMATEADWGICLARTDPDAPKHRGISYFLVDMSEPGIEVRPLRELTGDALFNEVWLEDVFVPDECLVASPGDGWRLARTTLANERVSMSRGSSLGGPAEALLAGCGPDPDEHRLTELGGILCDAQSGGLFSLRNTIRSMAGEQPGAESSVAKLLGVEHVQQVWETAVRWQGCDALLGVPQRGDPAWEFLNARCLTIAGGTTEIQLSIIGERLLGLPREPKPAARTG